MSRPLLEPPPGANNMNVFENLIEELKEENLIEETVIESSLSENSGSGNKKAAQKTAPEPLKSETANRMTPESNVVEPEITVQKASAPEAAPPEKPVAAPDALALHDRSTAETLNILPPLKNGFEETTSKNSGDENEFFRRRAIEEVSSLQIVEHIISGVEREQIKTLPKAFNNIAVSKALHDFLQISKNGNAQDNAQAEFNLMQETEAWYSALSYRDKNIEVAELRRYCETTKPVLSPQALTALARFYRNSPYSENVRAKFDMVATRLLTKELKDKKRELAFARTELIAYLGELYASWSSIPLYAPDEDSEILIATLKFEDFMNEADSASGFEELIRSDFFERMRKFKETTGENFYAPLVTATAIESNVRVGNRWVDLIRNEREKTDLAALEEKYGLLLDQAISDVTSNSMQLGDLLLVKKDEPARPQRKKEKINSKAAAKTVSDAAPRSSLSRAQSLLAVNKWLLAGLIVTIVASAAVIVWVDFFTPQTKVSPSVKKVNLENSSLKDDLKAARINAEIFYGVVQPSWETMSKQKKEELLKKLYSVGSEKGYNQVQLLDAEGKTVGYASEETITINNY